MFSNYLHRSAKNCNFLYIVIHCILRWPLKITRQQIFKKKIKCSLKKKKFFYCSFIFFFHFIKPMLTPNNPTCIITIDTSFTCTLNKEGTISQSPLSFNYDKLCYSRKNKITSFHLDENDYK